MATEVTATKQETETKTQGDREQKAQFRQQEVDQKSLLQSDQLQYIIETGVCPQEPECMKELRDIAAKHPWNIMTADEGQFLNLLLKLINAKNTMEIGVCTGYTLLATALALPDDGKILAMDINRENYELGLPVIQKAGVAHKIEFCEGPVMPLLDQLIEDKKYHGSYDFIFVVADKDNYINYHKRLIELVKVGGVIGYDNTLWNGSVVAPPDVPLRKYVWYYRDFVLEPDAPLRKYGTYFMDFVLEPDAPLRKFVRYFTDLVLELNGAFAAVSTIKRLFGFLVYFDHFLPL